MTLQDALQELQWLFNDARRKIEDTRKRKPRGMSPEKQEEIARNYERERDALQMAIDALKRE